MNAKTVGQAAIFVAMVASLGVVVYQTITHQVQDIFFSSMLTLILGKYLQQVGFSQGSEASAVTVDTVTRGVSQVLNGNVAKQIAATQEQTQALQENTAANTTVPQPKP